MMLYIPTCLMIPRTAQHSSAPTSATILYHPSEALLRNVRETFKKKPSVVWLSPRSGNA